MTAIFGGTRATKKNRAMWYGDKSLDGFEVTACGKFALFRYHGKKPIDTQLLLSDINRHSLTYRALTPEEVEEFKALSMPDHSNTGDVVIVSEKAEKRFRYHLWFGASGWIDGFTPNDFTFQAGTWFVVAVQDLRRVWVRGH